MNSNSQLLIFSYRSPIHSCTYLEQTILSFITQEEIVIWDFAEGKSVAQLNIKDEKISAINIKKIMSKQSDKYNLFVQGKCGTILLIKCWMQDEKYRLQILNKYNISMIGFAKVSFQALAYQQNGYLKSVCPQWFLTIRFNNFIERRSIQNGLIHSLYQIDDFQFNQVTCMLAIQIFQHKYLFVAEQGCLIKKILVQRAKSQSYDNIGIQKTLSIQSSEEVKIILALEAIKNYKAYVSIRNSEIALICLKQMAVLERVNIKQARLIKPIYEGGYVTEMIALTGKFTTMLMRQNKIIKKQKLMTTLIIDLDTCDWGLLGVTEDSKIFFLPFIE